jgi:trigger factor
MNIIKENIDELNAVLSIKLEKSDYDERVNNVLNDYRKKVKIDGFRPGKVPFGLINKMYRKSVLIEEVNKLISESISKYIAEEKLHILGDPLPHKDEMKTIDWDLDADFEFKFDLGIAPKIDVKVTTKDNIPYYLIKVDDELIDKYIDSYSQRFGKFENVEEINEKDLAKAKIKQLDTEDNILENGIAVEEATLSIEMIKEQTIKKQFLAAKKGDTLIIDLKKAYPNNAEIAGILKIAKDKAAEIEGNFSIAINEITRFKKAEINQELFDKVLGEGAVKSEKEFREKIFEEASKGVKQDSEYRFKIDAKEALIKKFKSNLPNDFLKKWLFLINEGKYTTEQIEKEFDSFVEDLKWQLIMDKIISENHLEVTEEDLKKSAREYVRIQLSKYGMANIHDEHLEEFTKRTLEREEEKNNIKKKANEEKVFEFIKSIVKIDEKVITTEKFNKLFEK